MCGAFAFSHPNPLLKVNKQNGPKGDRMVNVRILGGKQKNLCKGDDSRKRLQLYSLTWHTVTYTIITHAASTVWPPPALLLPLLCFPSATATSFLSLKPPFITQSEALGDYFTLFMLAGLCQWISRISSNHVARTKAGCQIGGIIFCHVASIWQRWGGRIETSQRFVRGRLLYRMACTTKTAVLGSLPSVACGGGCIPH